MVKIALTIFILCFIGKVIGDEEQPFGLPLIRNIPGRFIQKGNTRIFGGEEVEPHSLPYQVALYTYTASGTAAFCGGSVISHKYILTAAHCLWKIVRAEVILGSHDLTNPNENEIKFEVNTDNFILHEEFKYTVANDIAVIRLPKPVKFNDYIQPIELPTYSDKSSNFVGDTVTVSGWGRKEGNVRPDILLKTAEKIITNDVCVYFYGEKVKEDIHLCTSGENQRGPCNGDSGGPLVFGSKQIGIVSFGPSFPVGCYDFDFPSGYTKITQFLDWIASHTDISILYE